MVCGGVSQHHQTELVIAGNLNAVCYKEDILPLMWYPSCRLILT